jgi:uroporphyrin-III C-methyltransferase
MTFHAHPDRMPKQGSIALVGAGPGARDLLTLRAVDRLRRADVVYYDRLVDPDVLALTSPEATSVYVGKEVGAHAWTQGQIDAAIVASALQGLRVVRLKSGDPSLFGRATEELDAARAAGIPIEIVPGITAASAAAASLGDPLTARGQIDRVVLATGTTLTGDASGSLSASLVPGTRLVLYMAMQHLAQIEAQLIAAGVSPQAEVVMVTHVSLVKQRSIQCSLQGMAEAAQRAEIGNPAVVMISVPRPQAKEIRNDRGLSEPSTARQDQKSLQISGGIGINR